MDELHCVAIPLAQDIGTHIHKGVLVPNVAPTVDFVILNIYLGTIHYKLTKLLILYSYWSYFVIKLCFPQIDCPIFDW